MPAKDGLAALVEIRQALPATRCVLLASRDESARATQAIALGAAGYLLEEADQEELLRGIRAACRGKVALCPAATRQLISSYRAAQGAGQGDDQLTPVEQGVLRLLTRGLSDRGLAAELGVSERTVATHIRHILDKLALKNRVQAALYARERGLAA